MDISAAAFFSSLWPVIWPLLILAVVWILIRFVFKLALRVMLSGCLVLLVLAAGLLTFRLILH